MNSETQTKEADSQLFIRVHWLKWALLWSTFCLVFACGVGVGHYKWPPFGLIANSRSDVASLLPVPVLSSEYGGEAELLVYAFTDPIDEEDLYYPPITDLVGIREANERIFMRRKGFETAFEDLLVLGADQLNRPDGSYPVVRVRFKYQDRQYEAFAYGDLPLACGGKANLIIPGSGLNQSLGIATGDQRNYHHGILEALNGGGDIFSLIKPNEDFRAWHDGKGRKLTGDLIWNWHLNRGGSYSVSYLVESLAFTKWMKECYGKTLVAGLSQGGAAALINALQTSPNRAIVAAGFSVINAHVEWSGHNQLIGVPGYSEISEPEHIIDKLLNSRTNWFFSWGNGEIGFYKIEAKEQRTANFIGHLPNVTISIHEDGHVFPKQAIKQFLAVEGALNN